MNRHPAVSLLFVILLVTMLAPWADAAVPLCFGKRATFVGSAAPDIFDGTAADDVIVSKGGADEIDGRGGNDLICGGKGADLLIGSGGRDKLNGGPGEDIMAGLVGNDRLEGRGAGDALFPGLGNDVVVGGGGVVFDAVIYAFDPGPVVLNLSTKRATGVGTDTLDGIEDAVGTTLDDTLTGDAFTNGLFGEEGNDTLVGGGSVDFIQGSLGDDSMDGGDGFDLADFLLFTDEPPLAVDVNLATGVATGQGTDALVNFEGAGTSHASGDVLTGDANNNELYGHGGDDTLTGAAGSDFIAPGGGNDSVDGGDGEDLAEFYVWALFWEEFTGGTPTSVNVDLAAGTVSGQGTDTLAVIEHVAGTHLDDTVAGTDFANTLIGFEGNDTLSGRLGDDLLIGDCTGVGFACNPPGTADNLDGGLGIDECYDGEPMTNCETPTSGARAFGESARGFHVRAANSLSYAGAIQRLERLLTLDRPRF